MNSKEMKKKIEKFEEMLADMRHAIQDELMLKREKVYEDDYAPKQPIDNESDYTGNNRRNVSATVPYWVMDYYREVLVPKFEGKIQPYRRADLTASDIVRHIVYAAMFDPNAAPLSTYDEIKHLKD